MIKEEAQAYCDKENVALVEYNLGMEIPAVWSVFEGIDGKCFPMVTPGQVKQKQIEQTSLEFV